MRSNLWSLCASVALVAVMVGGPVAWGRQARNVWSGVYTTEQAARGKRVFAEKDCVTCHDESGRPGDDGIPPIVGPYFMSRWDGQTVGDVTTFIAENMPRTRPRTLSPQEVADVTAYLFTLNALPVGATALPADTAAARSIRFTEAAPGK
jgi:cytochrome c